MGFWILQATKFEAKEKFETILTHKASFLNIGQQMFQVTIILCKIK
jgi:hypothetical protein